MRRPGGQLPVAGSSGRDTQWRRRSGSTTTGNWPASRSHAIGGRGVSGQGANDGGCHPGRRLRSAGPTRRCRFETGMLAQQSQGAVVGRIGDTVVLATANAANGVREGIDFFPLTVDVEERMYAAGKIPGSFFRREGRPERHGHPHRPPHRPPAAALLRRRLPQRDPGRRHRPRRRPGEPPRRPGHQRRSARR